MDQRIPSLSSHARILLVEDDPDLVQLLCTEAADRGVQLRHAPGISDALQILEQDDSVSAIVLDLSLPDGDGLHLLQTLRTRGRTTPLLILSSRGGEFDKVLGLEFGANDYLAKPFSVRELFARLQSLVYWSEQAASRPDEVLVFNELSIHLRNKSVFLAGERLDLTPIEYRLLCMLAQEPGRIFGRDELFTAVWELKNSRYEHTVTTHLSRLRSKLEAKRALPRFIITVHGMGYRFATPEELNGTSN